ncbi:MAG: retroviral-like aspartic protease family protein, partial [Muribaculaceae bacterium]|nr:retroviral-like aspartic protease family protein [Muribaculaceae bacterium]
YAYLGLGDNEKAIACIDTIIARDTTSFDGYYNKACLYSRMNDKENALRFLRKSLELGNRHFGHMSRDADLDNIRDTDEFKALIEEFSDVTDDNDTAFGQRDNQAEGEETIGEVPFTKEDGVCRVKCRVNDLPLYFIFDTGASDVTLSMVEATFMVKNGYLSDSDIVGNQRYMDANGNVSVGTVINLKEVDFGGFTLNNVKASVVLNQKAPLLLGQSVLGRLGRIEIDNQRQVLKISHIK